MTRVTTILYGTLCRFAFAGLVAIVAAACDEDKGPVHEIAKRYKTLKAAIADEDVEALAGHFDPTYLEHGRDLEETIANFGSFIEASRDIKVSFEIQHMDVGERRASVFVEALYSYYDEASGSAKTSEHFPPWYLPEPSVESIAEKFRHFDFWIKGTDGVWRLQGNRIGDPPTATDDTGDTTAPGTPEEPIIYPDPDNSLEAFCLPEGYLEYDLVNYDVETRDMHNRPVTTAFENDLPYTPEQIEQMRISWFNSFAAHWQTFGGFPYQSMTLRVSSQAVQSPCGEGTGLGVDLAVHPLGDTLWPLVSWFLSHEMLHAWNGACIFPEMSEDYGDGLIKWFTEGVTNYYAIKFSEFYDAFLHIDLAYYRHNIVASPDGDLSLMDLGKLNYTSGWEDESVYQKGSLAALLLDMKLAEQGQSLDQVMQIVYSNHCVAKAWQSTNDIEATWLSNDEIEAAVAEVGGQALAKDFFDNFVYGNEPLPFSIDEDFPVVD